MKTALRLSLFFVIAAGLLGNGQTDHMVFVELANRNPERTVCGTPSYRFMDLRSGSSVVFSHRAIEKLRAGQSVRPQFGLKSYPVTAFSRSTLNSAAAAGLRFQDKVKPCISRQARTVVPNPDRLPRVGGVQIISLPNGLPELQAACNVERLARTPRPQRPGFVIPGRHRVQVTYDIGPDGFPINIETGGGDTFMQRMAQEWIESWRFESPVYKGEPVICRGKTMYFHW